MSDNMDVGDFSAILPNPNLRSSGGSTSGERTRNEFWLNAGYLTTNEAGQEVFVSLPLGAALDKLTKPQIPAFKPDGDNDFRQLRIMQADLVEQFQERMAKMKPGERIRVDMTFELYRAKRPEEVQPAEVAKMPGIKRVFG